VKVHYQVPVVFKLTGENTTKSDTVTQLGTPIGIRKQYSVKETADEKKVDIETDIISYSAVDEKPRFQGEIAGEFVKWIYAGLQGNYPKEAIEKNIQGVVRVGFTINKDGSISDIKSLQNVDPVLENAVIELVKKSPKWTPGKNENEVVKVYYQVPVVFKLDSATKTKTDHVKETADEKKVYSKTDVISYSDVDEKPRFQGKSAEEFVKWIYARLQGNYPKEAFEKKIQGLVRVGFTINKDGSISDIKSLRNVDPILENAVIELVKKSPKWTPGKYKNEVVRITYQVPVVFKLQ
jgi:TonB family protein